MTHSSPSLPHFITHADTTHTKMLCILEHCMQITGTLLYLYKSYVLLSSSFFFLTGARSRHIPDVVITLHSWIHLNLPLPLSFFSSFTYALPTWLHMSTCRNEVKNNWRPPCDWITQAKKSVSSRTTPTFGNSLCLNTG